MNISQVLLGPAVTEKSVNLAENNQHVLHVHSDASKTDIKNAIKKFYDIDVQEVKIIKMPTKSRVRGRFGPQIKRKAKKKAIVCLKSGVSFDLLKLAEPPKGKQTTKKAAPKKTEAKPSSSETK